MKIPHRNAAVRTERFFRKAFAFQPLKRFGKAKNGDEGQVRIYPWPLVYGFGRLADENLSDSRGTGNLH